MNYINGIYEQLEKSKPTTLYKTIRAIFWITAITAAYYLFTFNTLVFILCALAAVFLRLFNAEINVDFEYRYSAGDIKIIKINDKKKRRHAAKFNIKQIEAMFPENDANLSKYNDYVVLGKDCFNDKDKKIYNVLYTEGENKILLRFTPDETLLDLCYKSNPRAVIK